MPLGTGPHSLDAPGTIDPPSANTKLVPLAFSIARSMRPPEWVKNLLVFAAAIFSGNFFVPRAFAQSLEAFAALCLTASAGYLLNDVKDCEADRHHPEKCYRAIASGLLPRGLALGVAAVLAAVGIAIAFTINRTTGIGVVGYAVLTVFYTLFLKHVVVLDVLSLAVAFVLRAIIGAEAVGVEFSNWLVLCTFLLALFLGFGKRRHELALLEDKAHPHRPVLAEYSPQFLDMMISVVTAATMMSYALYTMAPETIARFHTRNLIYTTAFVLYGIFRYLYLIHQKSSGGNPAQVFFRDWPLRAAVLFWLFSIFLLRYS
jgi:4-hydroxybenzoate polyprenyltransferase